MISLFKTILRTTILLMLLPVIVLTQNVKYTTNLPPSMNPGETATVEINISKGSLNSFAKFQMDLPAGFSATPIEVKGGSWTFDQQRAKIVWVSIPSESNFTIKLKMTAANNGSNSGIVNTKFFYLENSVKQEFEIPPHTILLSGSNVTNNNNNSSENNNTSENNSESQNNKAATNNTSSENNSNNTIQQELNNAIKEDTEKKAVESKISKSTENKDKDVKKQVQTSEDNKISNTANTNTVYRLQIGAFASKPDKSKFKQYKDFWHYEENGLYKVTIGKFNNLNDAEVYKKEMNSKGVQGFVVSFENNVHVKIH